MTKLTTTTEPENLELLQLNPQPVSMWPDTLAWDLLFICVLLVCLFLLWRRFKCYQKATWKREAKQLAHQALEQSQADCWFQLIKRVQLTQLSRETVTSLSNEELLTPLLSLEHHPINGEDLQLLVNTHYTSDLTLTKAVNIAIFNAFISWIDSLPVEPRLDHQNSLNHFNN